MKKVVLLAFLFAVLGSSFLLGQEETKPFSWELKKVKKRTPQGDGLFTSKTYDEVWAATVKALMQSKYRVVHSDKDSGSISADELQTKYPVPLEIIIEKRENDIGVIVDAISDRPLLTLTYNSICKRLYQKIAVNLYGEEVIQKKKENVSAPVVQIKPEKSKSMPIVAAPSAPVEQPKPAPTIVETPFVRVNAVAANIRQSPSLQSAIIKKSSQGNEYKIIGIEGEWYEIFLEKNQNGYINKAVCDQIMVKEAKETPPPAESKPAKPAATAAPAQQAPTPAIPEMKTAPAPDQSGFRITAKGIKIGLNIANVTGDDVEINWENKTGFCAGGFLTFSLSDIFAIQPEAFFTMKGYKSEQEHDFYTSSVTYLEIPVLAKVFIPTGGNIKPNIFAGPSLGIKISGADYKSTDFGLVFGGGIDFALGTGKFLVECRYSMSLSSVSIFEKGPMTERESEDVKNRVISIIVGYSF